MRMSLVIFTRIVSELCILGPAFRIWEMLTCFLHYKLQTGRNITCVIHLDLPSSSSNPLKIYSGLQISSLSSRDSRLKTTCLTFHSVAQKYNFLVSLILWFIQRKKSFCLASFGPSGLFMAMTGQCASLANAKGSVLIIDQNTYATGFSIVEETVLRSASCTSHSEECQTAELGL